MKTLRKFAAQSARSGLIKGESAKQFAARNPQGAAKLAGFITKNHAALVREVSGLVAA